MRFFLFSSAAGAALVGIFAPAFVEHAPWEIRIGLLALGLLLSLVAVFAGGAASRASSITVKMRDGNKIGRIGETRNDK